MPRSRRAIELGTSLHPSKIISLSKRHPKNSFVGVDPVVAKLEEELKSHKLDKKPTNLEIHQGRAEEFLERQPGDHFSHGYAHFLFQHVKYADRHKILTHMFRSLERGGRFVTVEERHYEAQLKEEMQRCGFRVHVRRITPEELLKLGSPNADMNAKNMIRFHQVAESIPFVIPRRQQPHYGGAKTRNEALYNDLRHNISVLRKKWEALEGKDASPEVRRAIERIIGDLTYNNQGKPFCVITATKPQ